MYINNILCHFDLHFPKYHGLDTRPRLLYTDRNVMILLRNVTMVISALLRSVLVKNESAMGLPL